MIYQDDGAEKLAVSGEFDIAIPFSITYRDNEPEVNVFPSGLKIAEEFLRLFDSCEKTFTNEAISWAREHFEPFLSSNGFSLCEEADDYFLNYRITDPDRSLILNTTRRIYSVGELENLTEYDIDLLVQHGYICCATIIDNKIVSAACTNYSCALVDSNSDIREIEIGVETAEEYRGKGYGLSSVAALACGLTDHGIKVLYECESRNAASIALVKRLGGELFARNFCVVGRKQSDCN
ncbi:MAG: GNAT family N-acetyltransferase [Clostridiales bacterium]|nr:GNAT family N-acetyltransferase [Clostridiales bacterium]